MPIKLKKRNYNTKKYPKNQKFNIITLFNSLIHETNFLLDMENVLELPGKKWNSH